MNNKKIATGGQPAARDKGHLYGTEQPHTITEILTPQDPNFDDDEFLAGVFKTPEQLAAETTLHAEATGLSADHVVGVIKALAPLCAGLDRTNKLALLLPQAVLIGELPEGERPPVEDALFAILKNQDDVDYFMLQCPQPMGAPKFKPMTMADMMTMPPKEWLIDHVIGAGDLCMVYGAPGCGKTFQVIDLLMAACMGTKFAMRFDVARPLNVAYAAGEGTSGLPPRFAAAADFHGATEITNFTFFADVPQLHGDGADAGDTGIKNFVREWKQRQAEGQAQPLDILVIDTFHSATAGADENSAKDMGVALSLARHATQELGCACVLVHHTNKNGSAERGSSALRGAMDCMIEIRRISENNTGTKAVMHCAKLKDGEAWKDQTFDLVAHGESVRVWWDEPSDGSQSKGREDEHRSTMLDFMTSRPGTKLTAKVLAEVAGIQQSHAIHLLSRMVDNDECKSELMDTNKGSSNRNPLTYFVE